MSRYRRWSAQEKGTVAIEAIKGEKTIAEISAKYGVHANQIGKWKREAMAGIADIFSGKHKREGEDSREEAEELYKQIGKLKVENDFLKKTLYQA